MSVEDLREEACDCLFEIVNKGMDPVDKTKLVESLCQVLQSAGFFNIDQVPAPWAQWGVGPAEGSAAIRGLDLRAEEQMNNKVAAA